jgi:hypothetical protein
LPALASDTADWLGDAIPALEDEAPVESTPADSADTDTLRAQINAAVPLDRPQRPNTVADWLDRFAETLDRCSSREEVERELQSADALKAGRLLRGAARVRLCSLRTAALAKHGGC